MNRRGILGRMTSHFVLLGGIVAVLRTLSTEEMRPSPRDFPRYPPSGELLTGERDYVDWAGSIVGIAIRRARLCLVRSTTVAVVVGASSISVTFTLAVSAPKWLPELLGLVAALGTFLESLMHDREQAHLNHHLAVKLQKSLRDFNLDSGAMGGFQLRDRFQRFRREFEDVKEHFGTKILTVRGQEPPRVGDAAG